jgi:hypothetical protein
MRIVDNRSPSAKRKKARNLLEYIWNAENPRFNRLKPHSGPETTL